MAPHHRHEVRLAAASFVLAAAAGAVLLFAPLGTATIGGAPGGPEVVEHWSLLRVQGWSVAIPLAVPAVVAGLALAAVPRFGRRAAWAGAAILALWVLYGILSIGVFYAPSAVAMAAAGRGRRRRGIGVAA